MNSKEEAEFLSACERGKVAVLFNMLLKNKELIHCRDQRGWYQRTPLHIAAKHGMIDAVRFLLDEKAEVNSKDWLGSTPGQYAAGCGDVDVLRLLKSHGCDLSSTDDYEETAVHLAASKGHVNVLRYLQEIGQDLGATNKWDQTPLHVACEYGETQAAIFLLESGFSLHTKNKQGVTPMNVLEQDIGVSLWKNARAECLKQVQSYLSSRESVDDPQAEPTGHSSDIGDLSDKDKQSALKKKASLSETDKDLKSQATGDMKDSNKQQKMSSALNNNEESTLKSTNSSIPHIQAFKEAVARKGSLTCYITQCMPFGLPRVGKTCLYHCLLDRKPPGKPTTREELGSGPESTNVLTKRRMIQVKIHPQSKRLDKAIVAEECQWNEISTLQDEIALYLKAVHSQKKLHKNVSALPLPSNASKCINPDLAEQSNMPSSVMHFNTKEDDFSDDSSSHSTVELDDAILNAITDHVKHGEVDLAKVQHLLDKSLTIFYTDTGGQPEFQEALPALVAGPMIFMLAFNLFEPLEKVYEVRYACSQNEYESYGSTFTVKEVLMQCLSSIVSYHQAQSQHCSRVQHHATSKYSKITPPPTKILVVGTHSDLVSEEDVAKIDEAFQVAVTDTVLEDEGMIEYYNEEMLVIPINNYNPLDGGKVRDVFDRAVKKEIKGVSPYKVEIPVHWLGMELYLRQQESSVVSYQNCLEIGMKLGMQEEELSSCLWYLHHRMGTIRHYGGLEDLQDTVITEPSVLFFAVTEFITSTFTLKNVEKSVQRSFRSLGLFRTSEVEHIFNRHKDRLQIPFHKFIALLQHLNILGPAHDEDYDYFLPCALAHAPPLKVSKQKEPEHDPLLASFSGGFVPKGLFSGVLAKCCIGGWKIKRDRTIRRKPLLFRNQATFVFNAHSVTMAAKAKHLEFLIECSSMDDVSSFSCRMRDILKKAIEAVLEGLGYASNFKFGCYCTIPECEDCAVHFAAVTNESCAKATCSITQEVFSLDQKRSIWFPPKPDALAIKIQQVTNRTNEPDFRGAQGIIFIIGIYGADGTAKDVENVEATFKQLNFATFLERDPTSAQIASLINAAAACKYPDGYKFIAFYFAGHGGREESTGKLFINGLQLNKAKPEILHIEEHIVDPLQRLNEPKKLLFFDCCQTPGSGTAYRGGNTLVKNPKPLPNVLLAFSASEGQKSFGDKTKGGIWTYYLCKNLKKKKSITALLIKTSKDVRKLRREFQEPQTFCLPEFDEVILQQGTSVLIHSDAADDEHSLSSRDSPNQSQDSSSSDSEKQEKTNPGVVSKGEHSEPPSQNRKLDDVSPSIILKRHTPQLLKAIGDPDSLAVSMWANDLLTDSFNNELQTTQGLSQFKKAHKIMSEVYRVVGTSNGSELLKKFCTVLKEQEDPILSNIADEILRKLN